MELAVDGLSFVIHHFKGVTTITIHVLIAIRNAAITEQKAHLMGGLRTQCDEIPKHVRILHKEQQNHTNSEPTCKPTIQYY